MSEILIRNVHHLARLCDAGVRLQNVDVLLREGCIAAIGRNLEEQHPPVENGKRQILKAERCLALPGLVNTHHHLFQTLQRNLPGVQDAKLFDWLRALYEIWKFVDPEVVYWSTLLGCAELLLTGCTTSSDHHYLFPADAPPELLDAQLEAAERIGIRFHTARGSMSMGRSRGGLPPDAIVQDEDSILGDCERVLQRWHDPRPFAMRRVVLAPCSPFSVTESLMRATLEMARSHGVHCHTHLAETVDEEEYCLQRYGCRPLRWMEELGWLGRDIWFAHGIHFDAGEIELLARSGTGISHCPSSNMRLGSGLAPLQEMLRAGVAVGLGVDGSASNDTSDMLAEVRQAMLLARARGGAHALDAETALRLATRGGARLLGRADEIGSLEVGKAADLILIDLDRLDLAGGLSDPLAAIVFAGICHRVHTCIVNGRIVVADGRLLTLDEGELAAKARSLSERMLHRAGWHRPFGDLDW